MADQPSNMTLSELIELVEQQAENKRQTPSLIEADSPERYASWSANLEILRYKEVGRAAGTEGQTA